MKPTNERAIFAGFKSHKEIFTDTKSLLAIDLEIFDGLMLVIMLNGEDATYLFNPKTIEQVKLNIPFTEEAISDFHEKLMGKPLDFNSKWVSGCVLKREIDNTAVLLEFWDEEYFSGTVLESDTHKSGEYRNSWKISEFTKIKDDIYSFFGL